MGKGGAGVRDDKDIRHNDTGAGAQDIEDNQTILWRLTGGMYLFITVQSAFVCLVLFTVHIMLIVNSF